jgi:hypothetical protein
VAELRAPRSNPLLFAGKIALVVLLVVVVVYLVLLAELRSALQRRIAQLHAAGVPTDLAEVAPPTVSDDENAAVLYQEALEHLRVSNSAALAEFVFDYPPGSRDQRLPTVRRMVIRNQPCLRLMRQAAERHRWGRSPQAPMFHGWDDIRTAMMLLDADALVAKHDGDAKRALDSSLASLKLTAHLMSEPLHVTDDRLPSLQSNPMPQALAQAELDTEACRRLFQELGGLDFQTPFETAMAAEACMWLWRFDDIEHGRRTRQFMTSPGIDPFGGMPAKRLHRSMVRLYLSPVGRLVRLREELAWTELLKQGIRLAHKSYRDCALEYASLEDSVKRLPRYYATTATWMATLSWPAVRRDAIVAFRNAMQVALALKAYHAQRAAYPDSLEALGEYPGGASAAPEMRQRRIQGWKLPEDPFSGKDFGYRRKGAGFVLYSWGEDLRDDGGKPDRDMVWEFKQ